MNFPVDSLRKYEASAKRLFRFVDKNNKHWSAFNPSIAINPSGDVCMAVRSSNYLLGDMQLYTSLTTGTDIINHVWFATLDKNYKVASMQKLEVVGSLSFKRGIEDARLFWRDNAWHMTAVILEYGHTPVARLGLFRVDTDTMTATLIEKYEGPDKKRVEKNWSVVAGEAVPEFDFIYGPNSIYKDGKVKQLKPPGKYKALRGGTPLIPWEDGYLSVCHITRKLGKEVFNPMTFSIQKPDLRDYTHVFVKYAKSGEIVDVSKEFIFNIGGVEFASGIIEKDGKFYISYGYDDVDGWLVTLDVDKAMSLFE